MIGDLHGCRDVRLQGVASDPGRLFLDIAPAGAADAAIGMPLLIGGAVLIFLGIRRRRSETTPAPETEAPRERVARVG